MKQYINIITILCFSILSCTNSDNSKGNENLPIVGKIKFNEARNFLITPKDEWLNFGNYASIRIPQYAFLKDDGGIYADPVRAEILLDTTVKSLIEAGLDEDKFDSLLIVKGIIKVNFFDKRGHLLKINPESPPSVVFNDTNGLNSFVGFGFDSSMNIYYQPITKIHKTIPDIDTNSYTVRKDLLVKYNKQTQYNKKLIGVGAQLTIKHSGTFGLGYFHKETRYAEVSVGIEDLEEYDPDNISVLLLSDRTKNNFYFSAIEVNKSSFEFHSKENHTPYRVPRDVKYRLLAYTPVNDSMYYYSYKSDIFLKDDNHFSIKGQIIPFDSLVARLKRL